MLTVNDLPVEEVVARVFLYIDTVLLPILNTAAVIDPNYETDPSNIVTGIKGVYAFIYNHRGTDRGSVVVNLQVNGPEPVVAALVAKYGRQYEVWGRGNGHAVFALRR